MALMMRSGLAWRGLNAAVLIVFALITVATVAGLAVAATGDATLPDLLGLALAAGMSAWVLFRAARNLRS